MGDIVRGIKVHKSDACIKFSVSSQDLDPPSSQPLWRRITNIPGGLTPGKMKFLVTNSVFTQIAIDSTTSALDETKGSKEFANQTTNSFLPSLPCPQF